MFGHEIRQVGLAEPLHPVAVAQDGAAQRLVGIGFLLQPVEDDVVGRVQRLADLLQDHPALDLDLAGVEDRVQQDIGQHIHRQRHVILQDADVIGGHLAAGIGIDIAAHILDFLGDLQGAARLRALEGHMFEEMGDAVLLGPFVAAAGIDPDPDRGAFQPLHRFDDDAHAIGQGMGFDAHARRRSLIRVCRAARSSATRVTRSGRS